MVPIADAELRMPTRASITTRIYSRTGLSMACPDRQRMDDQKVSPNRKSGPRLTHDRWIFAHSECADCGSFLKSIGRSLKWRAWRSRARWPPNKLGASLERRCARCRNGIRPGRRSGAQPDPKKLVGQNGMCQRWVRWPGTSRAAGARSAAYRHTSLKIAQTSGCR